MAHDLAVSGNTSLSMFDRIQNPMDAIERMGNFIADSRMCGVTDPAQGMVVAMTCLAERITPIDFDREYHLIDGRLSKRADAMLAGFRKLGGRVTWKKTDATACIGVWKFEGNEIEVGYTLEDAERAQLYPPQKPGSNWNKRPDAMLRARCISKAVRMLAPEVVAGIYTPEEVEDFEPQKPKHQPTATIIRDGRHIGGPAPTAPAPEIVPEPEGISGDDGGEIEPITLDEVRGCLGEWHQLTKCGIDDGKAKFLTPLGITSTTELTTQHYLPLLESIEADYVARGMGAYAAPKLSALMAKFSNL